MKVGLIGSHGVGKTTLCFDLASRLKRLDLSVDLVKEVARTCPLPINRDTTVDAQAWILHTQIAEEIATGRQVEILICDRSVLDNYAYMVHRAGRQPAYDGLVASWIRGYRALVKVPIIEPPTFDGTRDVNQAFQQEIDDIIERLLVAFDVPAYRLDPGDRFGWTDAILTAVGLPTHVPQIDLFSPQP